MSKTNLLFAALLVAATALFLWAMDARIIAGLAYQPNMAATAASLIGALLIVTLVVERAAAFVNALVFGEEERQAEYERIQAAKTNSDSAPAEAKLKKVLDKKARLRLLLSFGIGLFISAAGVRTLEGLLVVTAAPNQPPVNVGSLLHPVDVVITAALIAGGSKALAFLAAVLRDLAAPPPQVPNPGAGGLQGGQTLQATSPSPMPPPPTRPVSVGPRMV